MKRILFSISIVVGVYLLLQITPSTEPPVIYVSNEPVEGTWIECYTDEGFLYNLLTDEIKKMTIEFPEDHMVVSSIADIDKVYSYLLIGPSCTRHHIHPVIIDHKSGYWYSDNTDMPLYLMTDQEVIHRYKITQQELNAVRDTVHYRETVWPTTKLARAL